MDPRNGNNRYKLQTYALLSLIIITSCILNFMNLWREGFANLYYSAGVRSMGDNLHAFLFNSLDSAGFVTIDKPPLGFWIQVLSTKIFGYTGLAILLPQALAGVLSVFLIFRIVSKRFGSIAGLISALTLAVTPVFVAVSRNNTIDSLLIFVLLLATGQVIKAAETSSAKHLIFSGILIGLGFNIKMLQAYMIVPAVYLLYLVFSRQKILKRIISICAAAAIMAAVSLSWVVAVDLVPAEDRPYIGSSTTNSAVDLAIGYNGLNRIIGGLWGKILKNTLLHQPQQQQQAAQQPAQASKQPALQSQLQTQQQVPAQQAAPSQQQQVPSQQQQVQPTQQQTTQQQQVPPSQQQTMQQQQQASQQPMREAGNASIIRLFTKNNAGQVSWFLFPILAAAIFFIAKTFKKDFRNNSRNASLFFWSVCAVSMFIYFSFASGLAHRYYFSMFAPSIAALSGIGTYYLTGADKNSKMRWIAPVAILITSALQLYIQSLYPDWINRWLIPACAASFALVTALSIICVRFKWGNIILISCMLPLYILPALWSATPAIYGNNNQLPVAGPELSLRGDRFANTEKMQNLVEYLEANREGAQYLAAAPSAMTFGAQLIIMSGEAVMVLGGFNGNDRILTVDRFVKMVKAGIVKYAVLPINANALPPAQYNIPATQNNPPSTQGSNPSAQGYTPAIQNPAPASQGPSPSVGQAGLVPAAQWNITAWIVKNGKIVSPKLWNPDNSIKGILLYRLN